VTSEARTKHRAGQTLRIDIAAQLRWMVAMKGTQLASELIPAEVVAYGDQNAQPDLFASPSHLPDDLRFNRNFVSKRRNCSG